VGIAEEAIKPALNWASYLASDYKGDYDEFIYDSKAGGLLTKMRSLQHQGIEDDLGMYGLPFETLRKLTEASINKVNILNKDAVYVDNMYGVTKLKPSKELDNINDLLFYSEFLKYTPVPIREVTNQLEKIHREQLNKYSRRKRNKLKLYKTKDEPE